MQPRADRIRYIRQFRYSRNLIRLRVGYDTTSKKHNNSSNSEYNSIKSINNDIIDICSDDKPLINLKHKLENKQ